MSGSRIAGYDNIMSIDYQMASARARQFEHERNEAMAELADLKARDTDETRRLLYMALAVSRTERYNLVGTLVNALVHHLGVAEADEAMEKLVGAVDGDETSLEWVRAHIAGLVDA